MNSKYLDSITREKEKKRLAALKELETNNFIDTISISNKNEVPWSSIFCDKRKVRADKKNSVGPSQFFATRTTEILYQISIRKNIMISELEYDYKYFENWRVIHIKWASQSPTISPSWRLVKFTSLFIYIKITKYSKGNI